MKPKYEEHIGIIPRLDGTLVVSLTWRSHVFQEELPRGSDRWTEREFKSHMRDIVIPKLRLRLLKVQRDTLADVKPEDATKTLDNFLPAIEYSEQDVINIKKAHAKRARKSKKIDSLN